MKMTAKKVEVDLELVTLEGETRVFVPKQPISAEFATKVMKEFEKYTAAEIAKPVSEQDKLYISNLKFLGMMYKDFDKEWVLKHFSIEEIKELKNFGVQSLAGIKKESEN